MSGRGIGQVVVVAKDGKNGREKKKQPETYRHRMALVRFERLMIGELHVNGTSANLWRITVEACHNGGSRHLIGHLQKCLIFALQHQHIGDASEGDAQLDDLRFAGFIGYVADVNDA